MAANLTDKITDVRNAARPNSARVNLARSVGGGTLTCDNLVGWPTASKVHFVTYGIDSSSNPVAGTQMDCYGIVSGNTVTSFTVSDVSDLGNSVNDVVEMLPTAAWGQDLADALTHQHSRIGAHVAITNTGGMTNTGGLATDTITVSSTASFPGGTTLPAGDIGFADLLSTIFSGQVTTYVNPAACGGTFYYINLGGIKLMWGKTGSISTTTTTASQTLTFPVGFFNSVQFYTGSATDLGSVANQYFVGNTNSTTVSLAFYIFCQSSSGTASAEIIVIGT